MKAILENDLTRQSEAQMAQFSERKKTVEKILVTLSLYSMPNSSCSSIERSKYCTYYCRDKAKKLRNTLRLNCKISDKG